MTAPAPTPAEAAIIDRFGIFDEERIVEEVARAIHDADEVGNYPKTWPWEDDVEENRADYRRLAAAAVAAYRATQDGGAEEAVRDALLKHHPIAHTMTGPLKGCRCGQVRLGQDVIAHVAAELRAAQDGGPVGSGGPGLVALHPGETYSTFEQVRAALAPQAGDGAR